MKVTARTDYAGLPLGKPFTLRLLVEVFGAASTGSCKPLNLSLVLDRSGSMEGRKLACALDAVRHVAGELTEDDRYSLTVFDNEVATLVSSCAGGDMKTIEKALATVHSRGCTNLYGGYENGVALARAAETRERLSRVMLFTDGLANRGEVRPDAFVRSSAKFLESGISTTTIGFCDDYDEHLLSAIAEAGGGNPYHVEVPEEVVDVFGEELGSLRELSATNCTIRFRPGIPNKIKVNQLTGCRADRNGNILVGDIPANGRRLQILELEVPPTLQTGLLELGKVFMSFESVDGSHAKNDTLRIATVVVEVMAEDAFNQLEQDAQVTLEAALAVVAKIRKEAWRLARKEQHREAADYLMEKATAMQTLGIHDSRLHDAIEKLRQLTETIRRTGEMTRQQQKRLYNTSVLSGTGRTKQLNQMTARRKKYLDE